MAIAGTILIAEDEALARQSLAEVLREEGYQVYEAADGQAALDILEEMEVDVVLSDLKMPQVDGLGLLHVVRDRYPQTMVLLMTAYASVDTVVEALRLGAQEGLFQRARGGTIFLDEIGELPLTLQPKLLRAVEEREVLPVGATTPVTIDLRILAATNRDLKQEVEEQRFRADLYYRLNVIELHLPPLRERREDIPLLVDYLVQRHNRDLKKAYKGVDNATMKQLMSLPWKGNVRELDNVLERAMILGNGEWVSMADVPRGYFAQPPTTVSLTDNLKEALQAYERSHIETVLKKLDGDKKRTAELLGVSLSSLYRKLDELALLLDAQ